LAGAYVSTLILTLTNPLTILSFLAVFAGLGLGQTPGDYAAAGWMVLGVLGGSALWWVLLTAGVSLLRSRFDARAMRWVNRVSGLVILGFGVAALLTLIA
jgi:threonine/homoserine/homoserine lactone efflux protein